MDMLKVGITIKIIKTVREMVVGGKWSEKDGRRQRKQTLFGGDMREFGVNLEFGVIDDNNQHKFVWRTNIRITNSVRGG